MLAKCFSMIVVLLLVGCQARPQLEGSGSEDYLYFIHLSGPGAPGQARRVDVEVRPPDPTDANQRAEAARLRQEILKAFEAKERQRKEQEL